MKKFDQLCLEKFSGYIDVGIDKTTNDYQKAITLVKESYLPMDLLCDHELKPGYSRLQIHMISNLDSIIISSDVVSIVNGLEVSTKIHLTDKQKQAINDIYALYNKDPNLREKNLIVFKNYVINMKV